MTQNDVTIPEQTLTQLCKIVIESTYFNSEKDQLKMILDIDQEELDEIINFAKKHIDHQP